MKQIADHLYSQGAKALFPTLKKDFHEKLSGSFSKFFGRLKKKLGIDDERKVLYSFRHTFKDTLNRAEMPSRYMKRVMGHTSGDGEVSDSYGSDLPFVVLVRHFKTVKFQPIPAKPWQPGKGSCASDWATCHPHRLLCACSRWLSVLRKRP